MTYGQRESIFLRDTSVLDTHKIRDDTEYVLSTSYPLTTYLLLSGGILTRIWLETFKTQIYSFTIESVPYHREEKEWTLGSWGW